MWEAYKAANGTYARQHLCDKIINGDELSREGCESDGNVSSMSLGASVACPGGRLVRAVDRGESTTLLVSSLRW